LIKVLHAFPFFVLSSLPKSIAMLLRAAHGKQESKNEGEQEGKEVLLRINDPGE
jgi:hypothetical protein